MNLTHILPISIALIVGFLAVPNASAVSASVFSPGCYVQAEVTSTLDGGSAYAEGTSYCLTNSGAVISEQTIGLVISGGSAPVDSITGVKFFVVNKGDSSP